MSYREYKECEEQKERVKACYGDWFRKLWGGSQSRSDCERETQDYRDCVHVRLSPRLDALCVRSHARTTHVRMS